MSDLSQLKRRCKELLKACKRATALGWAAQLGDSELVRTLLELGADPERCGAPWALPARLAEKRGHQQVVELLKIR